MAITSGSTTITFKAVCDEHVSVSVELDDDRNGGKTCFTYGDTVYIKVYTIPSNVTVTAYATAGHLSGGSTFTEDFPGTDEDPFVTFAGTTEASVSKPIVSNFSYSWVGSTSITPSGVSHDEGSITVRLPSGSNSEKFAGVMEVSYTTRYRSYSLTLSSGGGRSEYPVLVVFFASTD